MTWYMFGAGVVDRMLGRRLTSEVEVYCNGELPPPSVVRDLLDLLPSQSLQVTDIAPKVTFTIDDLIVGDSGVVTTQLGLPVHELSQVGVVDVEIDPRAAIRLQALLAVTPELAVDEPLRLWLRETVDFYRKIQDRFPILAALLESERSRFVVRPG